jgi:D-arginine dehydrogenase
VVPSLGAAAAGGGVLEPDASGIDVAALVDGYRRNFLARGGDIVVAHELLSARHDGRRWTARAGEHEFVADVIVDAAGAWADEVARRCGVDPIGLRPLRRTAALVAAPEHTARWPMVMDVDLGWYAEPEPGGLLVSPMDETASEPCDARPEEVDVALALERVNTALGLDLRHVRRAWAGLRTFSADRDPVAGPDPAQPAFVWLAGQGGSGIKTAPALAEIVVNAISSGAAVPAALDPGRFRSADR